MKKKKIPVKTITSQQIDEERLAIISTNLLINNFDDVIKNQTTDDVVRRFILQACIARSLNKTVPKK